MGKRPLERCTVAVTGDFGGQRSAGQVRKRIYVHGGTFASDVSPAVTHLVCSKEDFGKDVAMGTACCAPQSREALNPFICDQQHADPGSFIVRKARRLGSVKIVSWDWLEDALTKEHPVEETEYLMTAPVAECAAKSKEEKKAVRKENIKTGSTFSRVAARPILLPDQTPVEQFEKGCQEFKEAMFSGTPLPHPLTRTPC